MTTLNQTVCKREYFCPKPSKIFERHRFRLTKQEPGEKFQNFLVRLRNQSMKCQFKDTEEHLIDQIVEKCSSIELRQKILAIGDTINLIGIIAEAYALEIVNLEGFVEQKPDILDVNHITFSKDVVNPVNRLAVDSTTYKNIPCEERNCLELIDNQAITNPMHDLKMEFSETSISGSACTSPGQSIEPTKMETQSQVYRAIEHNDAAAQTTQPKEQTEEDKEEKHFKCNICGFATTQRRYLNQHQHRRHPTQKSSDCNPSAVSTVSSGESKNRKAPRARKNYLCVSCGYTCSSPSLLKVHMLRHTGEKPFKCSVCDYASIERRVVTAHMRTHTGEKPFACSVCDYRTAHHSNVRLHMRRHTGTKPFKCLICDYASSQSGGLKTHMKRHTGERPFKCSVCDFASTQTAGLAMHMKTHTGENRFKCGECKFACKQKSNLVVHMRTHTGEKPFECSVCDKAFRRRERLIVHTRTHTGEKPFKCSICRFVCRQRDSLKLHMRQHTGEKPFRCSRCDFASKNRGNLVVHMRTHTGAKPFKCSVCEFTSSQRSSVKRHMRRHSGENSLK